MRDHGVAQYINFFVYKLSKRAAPTAGSNAQQDGCLVVEVEPTDSAILPRLHIGRHLEVQGPFVTDVPNGWNEIHPAKMITEIA